jgi:hypothetical protein
MKYQFRVRTFFIAVALIILLLSGNVAMHRALGALGSDRDINAAVIGYLLAPLPLYCVWCLSLALVIEHRRSIQSFRLLAASLTACILWEFCFKPLTFVLQGYVATSATIIRWWTLIIALSDSFVAAGCWLLMLVAVFRTNLSKRD